jgi:hypothetical protein
MGVICTKFLQREELKDWPVADYSTMNSSTADLTGCVWSPTRPISAGESPRIEQQYMSPPTIDRAIDLTVALQPLSPVDQIEAQPRQQIIENQKSEVDRKRSNDSLPGLPQLNESYEDEEEQENMDNANRIKKLPAAMALVQCLDVDLVGTPSTKALVL